MRKIGTRRIETDRLILRQFIIEDATAMYECWASDPEVTKYLNWPAHASEEVSRAYVTDLVAKYDKGDFFDWVIEMKGVGAIGSIGVVDCREETESAELGYCIGRRYWGQGITPEALRAVLDYLFDEVGLQRVYARYDAANPNSGRVMAKAGMHYEGTFRRSGRNNRGIIDEVYYAMIAADRTPSK